MTLGKLRRMLRAFELVERAIDEDTPVAIECAGEGCSVAVGYISFDPERGELILRESSE